VLSMPDAELDTTRRVESVGVIPLRAAVLHLLVPGMAVGSNCDRRSVADGVVVTHWVISATRELFIEDEGVEI